MLLDRNAILNADDRPTETVPVPEWGGSVLVRGMSGAGRDAYEAEIQALKGKGGDETLARQNFRARLVARCIVGEDGKRLLSNNDIEQLGQRSAQALTRVFAVAARLSGMTATAVADAEKNSESTQSADSGSASPEN